MAQKLVAKEIQMAQKLVAKEKVVKMKELLKQSFYENVLITLQMKLRQKAPPPSLRLRCCGVCNVYAVNMQFCCLKIAKKLMHFSCERFASQISEEEATQPKTGQRAACGSRAVGWPPLH